MRLLPPRQPEALGHGEEARAGSAVPIFVDSNTSLEGIFFFSSPKASNRFSLGCPGSSSIAFQRFMSSTTTTLWKKANRKYSYERGFPTANGAATDAP